LFLDVQSQLRGKISADESISEPRGSEKYAERDHQQHSGQQNECSQSLDREAHLSL
jgi:hypothetical protein